MNTEEQIKYLAARYSDCGMTERKIRAIMADVSGKDDQAKLIAIRLGLGMEVEQDRRENYRFSMGYTKITCRWCGTEQEIPNETVEAMREYRCPECNHWMTDRELAQLKMHYYFMVWDSLNRTPPFPPFTPQFDYSIDLNPHLEKRDEIEE